VPSSDSVIVYLDKGLIESVNRHVVVDQLAAAASEDGWTADQACPLLPAAISGEPPDAAPVWKHTAAGRLGRKAKPIWTTEES
jgi:hypothetical protein